MWLLCVVLGAYETCVKPVKCYRGKKEGTEQDRETDAVVKETVSGYIFRNTIVSKI